MQFRGHGVHRSALRAALAVATTSVTFACGDALVAGGPQLADRPVLEARHVDAPEAEPVVDDVADAPPEGSDDLGTPAGEGEDENVGEGEGEGEGEDGGAGEGEGEGEVVGDVYCDSAKLDVEAWVKCCNENDWDPQQGCQAWGPPMPPEFSLPRELA